MTTGLSGNVVWVLAYKSDGVYVAHDQVLFDITEGIQLAAEYVELDSAADPRLIQVVLDLASPLLLQQNFLAELVEAAALGDVDESDGLRRAINIIEDKLPLTPGDLDKVDSARQVAEDTLDRLDQVDDILDDDNEEVE